MRWPGRSRAPISTRFGPPTAAAITSRIRRRCVGHAALRWNRSRRSFHQDLNGDGQIGLAATVIESSGSTSLTEIGNNFYLYDSTGSGPSLKFRGADFVAGQFGAADAPIGAEQTASGYEVAWKITGADQYTVWNTDSNGNYVSNIVGAGVGNQHCAGIVETSFHQDLNGDGYIGVWC